MAPAIEGLEGAIPFFRNGGFQWLQNFLNKIGIKVEPSQQETFCLINQSRLFNLTLLIYFAQDTRIAAPTVKWLLDNLKERLAGKKELNLHSALQKSNTKPNVSLVEKVSTITQLT